MDGDNIGKPALSPFEARPGLIETHPPTMANRRVAILSITGVVASILASVMMLLPLPFVVAYEGPTYDILNGDDAEGHGPLLTVTGAPTYESSGELRITTVAVAYGSRQRLTIGPVLRAWLSGVDFVFPDVPVETPEGPADPDDAAAQDWITSQERATVSALEELGIETETTLIVVELQDRSKAIGVLELDDIIVRAEGLEITSIGDLSDVIDGLTPGDDIHLVVLRGGEEVDVVFPTIEDDDGTAVMGIWINPDFEAPVDVSVDGGNVGGPSAGMMFALAIMETLTPEDESGGVSVAGTGTISLDGDVGPIGGITLKLAGAKRDGAAWFIAPVENCEEVVGNIPDGLNVVAVDTLEDAYTALIAIGEGDTDSLPTCS